MFARNNCSLLLPIALFFIHLEARSESPAAISPLFEVAAFFDDATLWDPFGPSVILLRSNSVGTDLKYLCVFGTGELRLLRFSPTKVTANSALLRSSYRQEATVSCKVSRDVASRLMFWIRSVVEGRSSPVASNDEDPQGSLTVSWSVLPAKILPVVKEAPDSEFLFATLTMVAGGTGSEAVEKHINAFLEGRFHWGTNEEEKEFKKGRVTE